MSEGDPFASLRALFGRYGFAAATDADWRPTADDWMRLALRLALKHGEDGFELSKRRHRAAAWAESVRNTVMDNIYLEAAAPPARQDTSELMATTPSADEPEKQRYDVVPSDQIYAACHLAPQNKRRGMTLDLAARQAKKIIDRLVNPRDPKEKGLQGVKPISAASIKTAYSAHRSALKRGEEYSLPPMVADYLRRDGEWRELLKVARAFTVSPNRED